VTELNPVLEVTKALVQAGFAFEFSPYQPKMRVAFSTIWLLEFEGGQEARLWVEDDEITLALAVFLRSNTLIKGEDTRELKDGAWLIRNKPSKQAVVMVWLKLEELDKLSGSLYGLLHSARKEERRAQAKIKRADSRSLRSP